MPCHVTRTDAYARFQVPGKRSVCPGGPALRTNLLSVLHRARRCCPVHLALHHGSFQALVQISVTIYLKGILTKGFDLGKSVAWMMETIQNPSTSVREQKALVNSRVWCQQQSGVLLARAELARVSCFSETLQTLQTMLSRRLFARTRQFHQERARKSCVMATTNHTLRGVKQQIH